jgi:hypothetical protein
LSVPAVFGHSTASRVLFILKAYGPWFFVQVQLKEGRIEKYILRKAFDDKDDPFLPQVDASCCLVTVH